MCGENIEIDTEHIYTMPRWKINGEFIGLRLNLHLECYPLFLEKDTPSHKWARQKVIQNDSYLL